MPRIIPYEQQTSVAGAGIGVRQASASDFGGNTGLAQAGQQIENASTLLYDRAQRQEVSDVSARMAKLRADWTVEFANRANQSPAGDTTFADKFNQDFGDALSQAGDGIETEAGRRAWQRESTQLAAEFTAKAGVYQAQSVGLKAKQDYLTALDASRNTLINDPTQHDAVLASSLAALDDPNGAYALMPAKDREQLRTETRKEIALSAVQGVIRMDPELAKRKLSAGDYDSELDADKKAALLTAADTAIHGRQVAEEHAAKMKERADKAANLATENKFFTRIQNHDPTVVADIMNSNLPATGDHSKEGLLKIIKGVDRPDSDSTHYGAGFVSTIDDIRSGKIRSEQDLYGLMDKGSLTFAGLTAARAEFQGKHTVDGEIEDKLKKTFEAGAKSAITGTDPLLHMRDPKGDQLFTDFMTHYLTDYRKAREAGKTPQQLFDSKSPDYIGKSLVSGGPYVRPLTQRVQDLVDAGNSFSTPDTAAAAGVPVGTTRVAKDKSGSLVYEVKGKWQYRDGRVYKP